jgi:ribonuclease P protein component
MGEDFSPLERIRKKKDFNHLYKKGTRYRGKYFILIYLSNELVRSRVAVVASKKIGNAVQRNRIKRRFRTLFRRNKKLLQKPLDMIIIPQREIHEADWKGLERSYVAVLKAMDKQT